MPSNDSDNNSSKVKDNSESAENNNSPSGKRSTASKKDENFLGVDISHWALYAGVGALVVSLISPIITPKLGELQNVLAAATRQQQQQPQQQQPQQPDMTAQYAQQQQVQQQQQQQQHIDAMENGVPTTAAVPQEQAQPHDTRYIVDRDPFGSAVKIPVINRRGSSISQNDLTRVSIE